MSLIEYVKDILRCSKCGGMLRSIGQLEDEYGPHEAFVCDGCAENSDTDVIKLKDDMK